MLIQVNTDSNTQGTAELTESVQHLLNDKLARFSPRITRAEVHLNDENGTGKSGSNDKRCLLELRLAGMDPITATEHSNTYDLALRGAVNKVQTQLDTILGKLGRS